MSTYTRCTRCFMGWFGESDTCGECGGNLRPDPLTAPLTIQLRDFFQAIRNDAIGRRPDLQS